MHTLVEVPVGGSNGGTHVPAFLAKLWKIVDDPSTNDLICWSDMGNSFIIKNQAKFARDLLPLYYKHNNMASFVRQLNMYGFHKVVSVEQGGLRVDKDEMEFAHPFFLKGQESSLELIKRKIPASKHEESRIRPDSLNKVLMDVRQMKGRQESMDTKLITMKRENEALWRELASLRQKHAKQTQIVSKLLQFLVGMMSQQTPRLAFKRRMPLMLNDKEGVKQKLSRTDATEPTGPVIHDVTELLESDDSGEEMGDQECLISAVRGASDNFSVQSPLSNASKSPFPIESNDDPDSPNSLFSVDPTIVNPAIAAAVTALPPTSPLAQMQQLQQQQQSTRPAQNMLDNRKTKPKAAPPAPKRIASPQAQAATLAAMKQEVVSNNLHQPFANLQAMSPGSAVQHHQQMQPQQQHHHQQQQQHHPQLIQIPSLAFSQSQANSNNINTSVPTTLYFTAPGMSEPVQVVLSIPDHNTATVPTTSGMHTIPTPVVHPTTSTTVASKRFVDQHQQQQQQHPHPQSPLSQVPMNKSQGQGGGGGGPHQQLLNGLNGDAIGRNQTVNPKFFLKPNGNAAPQDLDGHLDEVELGLNNLRDLFKGTDYNVDNDTIIGVSTNTNSRRPFNFSAIDPEIYTQLFSGAAEVDNTENQVNEMTNQLQMAVAGADAGGLQRQEVVAYNPSLFELAEEDTTFFDESSNIFLDDELESMLTTDRDTLKKSDGHGQSRAAGLTNLTFSGINLHNSLDTPSGPNTPLVVDAMSLVAGSSAAGAGKRKRK